MTPDRQALALATVPDKTLVQAWDRLSAMLNVLDSKTSALLRFNAIVVAALAYLVVVAGADPFAQARPIIRTIGLAVGHISLVLSVASCGFSFPVIAVAHGFFDAAPGLDAEIVARLGAMVARRTRLYAWAWRLAVAGGSGFALLVALAVIH
jgi:hypothetical protein